MADQDSPKLHIDSDWKAQAQAEKQRLADEAKAKQAKAAPAEGTAAGAGAAGAKQGQMPEAKFETIVQTYAAQAMMSLGQMADPRTGQRMLNLDYAKLQIDMLGVIEEKTKGNLSEDEEQLLLMAQHQLRQAFIQVAQAVREQRRGDNEGGQGGGGGIIS